MRNRLASATSPYLLQHAGNPVAWEPWDAEALTRAQREQKPIFLSVGYSSCHWCHVMEHESFEDAATAELLNREFVAIKVDREERPDIDAIYQLVVQLTGRSGGWPLSVFLLPDLRPFFGGTYFPPESRHGLPGFRDVLGAVATTYREAPAQLIEQAEEIAAAIRDLHGAKPELRAPSDALLTEAAERLLARFDVENHGFGTRPKFPNTMALSLLVRAGHVQPARDSLAAMRRGGIWDQLGGGFHRYSTDERWLVPHFEKMLYDNALLLGLCTELRDADTAAGIVSYLREIEEPTGGFAAAEDADSEGREGVYFVWTPAQIEAVLGADAKAACAALGVTEEGNFVDHGVVTGASVLSEVAPLDPALREKLRAARDARKHPFRDRKVITAWNALAVASLAEAALVFDRADWLVLAERTYAAVSTQPLRRYSMQGAPIGEGFLEDHAYLAEAAFVLHGATGKADYLRDARNLADAMLARFWDGACFYGAPANELLARPREIYDQAVPSPIAVACKVLLRLSTVCAASYAAAAEQELGRLAEQASRTPLGMSETLASTDRWRRSNDDLVLARPFDAAWARAAFTAPLPNRNVVWLNDDTRELLAETAPGKTRGAFVCRNRACSLPLEDLESFATALG